MKSKEIYQIAVGFIAFDEIERESKKPWNHDHKDERQARSSKNEVHCRSENQNQDQVVDFHAYDLDLGIEISMHRRSAKFFQLEAARCSLKPLDNGGSQKSNERDGNHSDDPGLSCGVARKSENRSIDKTQDRKKRQNRADELVGQILHLVLESECHCRFGKEHE